MDEVKKQTWDETRRKISAIVGQLIPPGQFEEVALEVDRSGMLNQKNIIRILIVLYNYLEANATE